MKLIENIKKEIHSIWSVESNKRFIKDTLMFFVATIIFHILYWNTDMNLWIFGPLTNDIFDFFTMIAYKASAPLCSIFIDKPFIMQDSSFYFYSTLPDGSVVYDSVMEVIHDCSGIKQLLQWALIMILCRGKWTNKILYYLAGCVIILLANIIRLVIITKISVTNPEMFEPIHDWVARPMMYVIIFSMWYFWLYIIDRKKKKSNTAQG